MDQELQEILVFFVVVNENLNNTNIEFGNATMEESAIVRDNSVNTTGISFKMDEVCEYFGFSKCNPSNSSSTNMKFYKFKHEFEKNYLSLPSVIVTPVLGIGDDGCNNMDTMWQFDKNKIEIPHCVVETITKKYFTAKCGCVTFSLDGLKELTELSYEPLEFNYLAVGPVEKGTVDTENFDWTDLVSD